jgi:hypothetical protein
VAAMPSFSRVKKLSVLGVAIAAFTVPVANASADDVWLWACHGPGGQALPDLGTRADSGAGGSCLTDNGGAADALQLRPAGAASATRAFDVPSNLTLASVKLGRTTALGTGQKYVAGTETNPALESLDSTGAPLTGENTVNATGTQLRVGVTCPTNDCTTPAGGNGGVDLSYVAMRVTDSIPPRGAVGGWRSPASDDPAFKLNVQATDAGVGLKSATAFVDGGAVVTKLFGDASCRELSDGSGQVDLPYGAVGQNDNSVTTLAVGCLGHGSVDLPLTTKTYSEGYHAITVTVSDWAGNTTTLMDNVPTEVLNNVDLGKSSQTLNIGTSGTTTPTPNANNNGGSGGVAGATAQSCRSPRLSFSLSNKPMRISKGVPVLQYGKRYRFNGRLTCVINGKRKAAPKRARVDILNKVGKKTVEKAGTTVRDKGRLTIILSYKSSRTVTFRFTNSDGQRSTVNIKIKVEKKKKSRR